MLGALSSENSYTYIGTDPNTKTYQNLNILGQYIEKAFGKDNVNYHIYKEKSEDLVLEKESVDFAFSSPPYFNLEVYSKEETQSYNKYPDLENWLEFYVRKTIKNIYEALKPEAYYAVNIADFKLGKTTVEFVKEWITISEEEGFSFVETIDMKLQTRRGVGHGENARGKREGVFVFKKD